MTKDEDFKSGLAHHLICGDEEIIKETIKEKPIKKFFEAKMTKTYKYQVICEQKTFKSEFFDYKEAQRRMTLYKEVYPTLKGEWIVIKVEEVKK